MIASGMVRARWRIKMADSTLQIMLGATFDLATVEENKWLSPGQQVQSYEEASAIHVKRAEHRISWASRLLYSDKKGRRELAVRWIQDAKTRVIAAETCLTLASHIDKTDRPSLINPWQNRRPGERAEPSVMHRIEIIESFLTKQPLKRRKEMEDEIPF